MATLVTRETGRVTQEFQGHFIQLVPQNWIMPLGTEFQILKQGWSRKLPSALVTNTFAILRRNPSTSKLKNSSLDSSYQKENYK
jgi:hypothetical protein